MRPKAEWAINSLGHGGERNNRVSKIKHIETKKLYLAKYDSAVIVLVFKAGAFRYLWAIT